MTAPSIRSVIREVEDLGRGRHDNRQAALDASDALVRLSGCSIMGRLQQIEDYVSEARACVEAFEDEHPTPLAYVQTLLDELNAILDDAEGEISTALRELD